MTAIYRSRVSCSALVSAHIRSNTWLVPVTAAFRHSSGLSSHFGACSHSVKAQAFQNHQSAKQHPRFYAPQLPSSVGAAVELDPDEARHAIKVLRLKKGDPLDLCDGQGGLVQCEVAFTDKNSATVVATAAPTALQWQGPKWVVAAACLTLKGGRTDWLIEKATELGAYAVLPIVTERSQTGTTKAKFKSLSSKGSKAATAEDELQPRRMQRLALAATKQSLRTHALHLLPATTLSDLLPELRKSPVSLVATAGAPPVLQLLQDAFQKQQQQQQSVGSASDMLWQGQLCYLLIGPEGDFTPNEVQNVAAAGVLPVGLGSNRLRTETAAMALLAAAVLHTETSCKCC